MSSEINDEVTGFYKEYLVVTDGNAEAAANLTIAHALHELSRLQHVYFIDALQMRNDSGRPIHNTNLDGTTIDND